METLNRLPWAAQNAVFKRLAEISDLSSLTREERENYDSAIRIYRDNIYTMEGERQKGREEERRQNARKMKSLGLPPDIIHSVTGLSTEEIEKL